MTELNNESKGGRPKKGTIFARAQGFLWVKFTWTDPTTLKTVRKSYPLETRDKRLANLKRAELAKKLQRDGVLPSPVEPEAKPVLLFQGAAEALLEKSKIKTIADRVRRVTAWAYPAIGNMPVGEIMPRDISRVLEACRDAGKAKQTVQHLKADLSSLFHKFEHEGWVPFGHGDVVRKTPLPEDLKVDDRARSVLTDDELRVYLDFRHPIPKHDLSVLERQTMVVVARLYGGLRTSEILRMRWEDLEDGRIRRSKTNRKERSCARHDVGRPRQVVRRDWPKNGARVPRPSGCGRRGRTGQEQLRQRARAGPQAGVRLGGVGPRIQQVQAGREQTDDEAREGATRWR